MARPLRIDVPDGVYHVTGRGLERRPIVRNDADRLTSRSAPTALAVRAPKNEK